MKTKILPIIFGFFIMRFCDLVGISTTYAGQEYNLSKTTANFLPSMVFLWFLVFSVPTGLLMNRAGRKNGTAKYGNHAHCNAGAHYFG